MYVPSAFERSDPAELFDFIEAHSFAVLVSDRAEEPFATHLPLLLDRTAGPHGTLIGHMARANPQWRELDGRPVLAVFSGPHAYVSPSWYASKREHGRVVPTWNYSTAHVYGELVVHEDAAWLGDHVRRLTDLHEAGADRPWSVDDAPERFISGQLRAIVGVELIISRIEGKTKLSQNRPDPDVRGVIAGLQSLGQSEIAGEVERARRERS